MREEIPQTILESVESIPLPTLPQALLRLLALVEDDRAPMAAVASLVALDPALAAHLLTVANSPPFRQVPASTDLESSLAAVGPRLLRVIATSLAARSSFSPVFDERNFDYPGFWRHSLLVAELARYLAVTAAYPDAEEAYLAGLLHDIGQLLMVVGVAEGYGPPGRSSAAGAAPPECPNGSAIGPHATVGARLVEQWNLASFMADAVLFHRLPVEDIASADLLSRIVWSAHNLADTPDAAEPVPSAACAVISSLIGVDADRISGALSPSRARLAEHAASLGIDLGGAGRTPPGSSFIARELTSDQRPDKDPARLQLEAQVRTMAVMHSLHQDLLSLPGEAALYGALRESARILFGLGRPLFLVTHPAKPILSGAEVAGQSPLVARLEVPLGPGRSLAASAFRDNRPWSSHDDDSPGPPSIVDIQLGRLLRAEGLICIPMRDGERASGVMVYGVTAGLCLQTRDCRDRLTGFASIAARTLEAFRLLREHSQGVAAEIARNYEQNVRKLVHEVVNPLGIINNYLQIVARKVGDEDGVGRELVILKEEIARVERIIRRVGDQAERPPTAETVSVNGVIGGMLALYGESLFEACGIAIDQDLAADLPVVKADRDSLKQILLNLWKNSAEAMPDGGRLRITTCAAGGDNGCSTVEIRLSDTGPGIPPDVMECLFQPLDPDRRPAHSGVGLSIVAALVERLGGTISCQSSPDRGTDFAIRLPRE
jgi:HD-like signal output (HDOD) protein/signal transduction histidine kinase